MEKLISKRFFIAYQLTKIQHFRFSQFDVLHPNLRTFRLTPSLSFCTASCDTNFAAFCQLHLKCCPKDVAIIFFKFPITRVLPVSNRWSVANSGSWIRRITTFWFLALLRDNMYIISSVIIMEILELVIEAFQISESVILVCQIPFGVHTEFIYFLFLFMHFFETFTSFFFRNFTRNIPCDFFWSFLGHNFLLPLLISPRVSSWISQDSLYLA